MIALVIISTGTYVHTPQSYAPLGLPNSPLNLPVGIELRKEHHHKLKDAAVKKNGRDESDSLVRNLPKGAINPVQPAYVPEAT